MPRRVLAALAGLALGCGATEPAPSHPGTFRSVSALAWPARALRPATTSQQRHALVTTVGEVAIIEGDETLISGIDGQLGLRFDETRNDLAAVVSRFSDEAQDREAVLILFTTFDDRGGGGPAYFVPLFNDVLGTGLGPVDQRAVFGTDRIVGLVNMKRRESHLADARLGLLVHEIAHPHLAYLSAAPAAGSTVTVPLLGRQQAHWHAALHTDGSVLGGHGFVERTPGRFTVARRDDGLSALDLYGLGLLGADEVPDLFFVEDARTLGGFAIPAEAQLSIGDEISGRRHEVGIERIVQAVGPRDPAYGAADPRTKVVFALLTAPGQTATSTAVKAEAEQIDALRSRLEAAWPGWTRGRGQLCTRQVGCDQPADSDAGIADAGETEPSGGCRGYRAGGPASGSTWLAFLLGAVALARTGRRKKQKARART